MAKGSPLNGNKNINISMVKADDPSLRDDIRQSINENLILQDKLDL